MPRYKSVHTGPQIDSGVARALPGGAIDLSLSNKVTIGALYGADLNTITEDGHYRLNGGCTNVPISGGGWEQWTQLIVVHGNDSNNCAQIMPIYYTNEIYTRTVQTLNPTVWTDWVKLATATPPTEHDFPLASGVTGVAKYWKNQFGEVSYRIAVSGVTNSGQFATIPVGYRPISNINLPAHCGSMTGAVSIETDGVMKWWGAVPSSDTAMYSANTFVAGN